MSTATETTGTGTSVMDRVLGSAATAEEKAKPQRAVSFKVTGIEEAKQTGGGEGDYMRARITIEPTRGSARFFPAIMFRPEMFSPGFNGSEYTNYAKNPLLEQVNPNSAKGGTKGEAFRFVYESNVVPGVKRDRNGNPIKRKGTDQYLTSGNSVLQMCCGGTLEGIGALLSELDKSYKGSEHTTDDIIAAIRSSIQANAGAEHVAVLRQSRGRDGELDGNWEVNYYNGILTSEQYEYLQKKSDKEADNSDIGKRLTISFSV